MKIAVVGMGYVGMSVAVLLSQKNSVKAFDIVESKVNMINERKSPIVDKEITEFLTTKQLDLVATTDFDFACSDAELVFISTPTDYDDVSGYFNTSSVEQTIMNVAKVNPSAVMVIKSTIPIGFTEQMNSLVDNAVLFSPEFLREGSALYDNLYPSRIIVGIDKKTSIHAEYAKKICELFKDACFKEDVPVLVVGYREAESIKLFANTYLAMRVSYFNELDSYAEVNGLDCKEIIQGVCLDPRIGSGYNNPSFGYGGYCLPKDSKQLLANFHNTPQNMIRAIVESNSTRKNHIVSMVINKLGNVSDKKPVVGIFRLQMKANSDNFRGSSIIDVAKILNSKDVDVIVFEPMLDDGSQLEFGCVVNDLALFKARADVIIVNRNNDVLDDVAEKVYTRDAFGYL